MMSTVQHNSVFFLCSCQTYSLQDSHTGHRQAQISPRVKWSCHRHGLFLWGQPTCQAATLATWEVAVLLVDLLVEVIGLHCPYSHGNIMARVTFTDKLGLEIFSVCLYFVLFVVQVSALQSTLLDSFDLEGVWVLNFMHNYNFDAFNLFNTQMLLFLWTWKQLYCAQSTSLLLHFFFDWGCSSLKWTSVRARATT